MQRQKNRETNEVLLSENLENCLTGQCIASDDTQLYWEKLGCGATNSNPNNKTNVRDFCFLLLLSYKKRSSSLWKDKALNQDETLIFCFLNGSHQHSKQMRCHFCLELAWLELSRQTLLFLEKLTISNVLGTTL